MRCCMRHSYICLCVELIRVNCQEAIVSQVFLHTTHAGRSVVEICCKKCLPEYHSTLLNSRGPQLALQILGQVIVVVLLSWAKYVHEIKPSKHACFVTTRETAAFGDISFALRHHFLGPPGVPPPAETTAFGGVKKI